MGLFHVDGNLASLLKGVGTHLAVFNSTCRCRGASVDSKAHLADLASASLTGCIYVDASTDAADRVFTLTQTSMRSHQQAEEAMGMLIKPSVLMLGYQQQQSERCTNLSACDWLVDSLGSSDLDVRCPSPWSHDHVRAHLVNCCHSFMRCRLLKQSEQLWQHN